MKQPLVKEYLNTFNSVRGQGNGRDPQLYSVLSSLYGMNACQEAWDKIIEHAIVHNAWTRPEVMKKIQNIKNGY
jgi:hypothetical protein